MENRYKDKNVHITGGIKLKNYRQEDMYRDINLIGGKTPKGRKVTKDTDILIVGPSITSHRSNIQIADKYGVSKIDYFDAIKEIKDILDELNKTSESNLQILIESGKYESLIKKYKA
jgi:hypothetical protein